MTVDGCGQFDTELGKVYSFYVKMIVLGASCFFSLVFHFQVHS